MTETPALKAADLFDLSGEVALVTGASSGLGKRFRARARRQWRESGAGRAPGPARGARGRDQWRRRRGDRGNGT